LLELNKDLYVAFDIQAYQCGPRVTEEMNPLQYVLSFNPPLILTNFSMAPLEVFEIDIVTEDDETKSEEKNIGKIAPETSKYIVELDMTENN